MKLLFPALAVFATLIACSKALPYSPITVGEWIHSGIPDPSETLMVSIALRQRNVDTLQAKVNSVSNPSHSDYTNYWSRDTLRELIKPAQASIDATIDFLVSNGISDFKLTHSSDFVRVILSAAEIERMFQVELKLFTHLQKKNLNIVRSTTQPQIPKQLKDHVDFIGGFNHFPVVNDLSVHNVALAPDVTPDVLKKLYSVTDAFSNQTSSSQAVAEFQLQSYSPHDLQRFQNKFNLMKQEVRNVTGPNTGIGHIEANLDVQYIMAMGQGIPTDFYLHSGFAFDLIGWITTVEGNPNSAYVWSVSYGEDLSQVTADYAQRLDREFQKLAVLGFSIIFASGDSGVYSRTGGTTVFHPSFPACLPTVTAVGATVLNENGTETKSTDWSGGGFSLSNYFTRQANATYQVDAVSAYFSSGVTLPAAKMYDANGRGFPDAAALGVNFKIFQDDIETSVSGTSAAAPTFAGIISLVNDRRMTHSKAPLGFLNPFLYKNPQAFNDILDGFNANGEASGFYATKGWDPVTGLGTVNYPLLLAAALAAP